MNFKSMYAIMALAMGMSFVSCSDDEGGKSSSNEELTDTEMIVSGVWKSGEVINLDRHLVVPEGESLTIEPGVTVIVSDQGVGVNHVPIEISVKGNLYVLGTESITAGPQMLIGGLCAVESSSK